MSLGGAEAMADGIKLTEGAELGTVLGLSDGESLGDTLGILLGEKLVV